MSVVCLYNKVKENCVSGYLAVILEHFDSFGGDEEIRLYHWLRLILKDLHNQIDKVVLNIHSYNMQTEINALMFKAKVK